MFLCSAICRLENESPESELPQQDEEMIDVGRMSPLSGEESSQSAAVDVEKSPRQQTEASGSPKPLSGIKAVKKYTFDLNTFFGSKNKYDEISTRVAVTEDGRIFISDFSNNKVSAFSKNPVIKLLGCVTVREVPRGIAVINDTEIVVCTDRKCLVILNITRPKPKLVDKMKLPFKIRDVTKHRDKFVVTCLAYRDVISSVKLIDRSGTVYWSVSHDSEDQLLFNSPFYISRQNHDIFSAVIVSDYRMKTLTLLNADTGSVVTRRQVTENEPFGVTTDATGNIYVCYPKKDKKQEIAVFSSDLSEEKSFLKAEDGLDIFPVSIVYDNCAREIFVAHSFSSTYECYELI